MSTFRSGFDMTARLALALGLNGLSVSKIVIEADCKDVAKAYVVLYPSGDACERVAKIIEECRAGGIEIVPVADAQVRPDCTVKVEGPFG